MGIKLERKKEMVKKIKDFLDTNEENILGIINRHYPYYKANQLPTYTIANILLFGTATPKTQYYDSGLIMELLFPGLKRYTVYLILLNKIQHIATKPYNWMEEEIHC